MLRYTKLTDSQVLARLMTIVEKETVQCTDDGLEAIVFTAQGDMRQVVEHLLGFVAHRNASNMSNVLITFLYLSLHVFLILFLLN